MRTKKSEPVCGPSTSYSKKKRPKSRIHSSQKSFPVHAIPRSKMDRAMKFLEADSAGDGGKMHFKRRGHQQNYACFGNIASKVSASHRADNFMNDTANVLEVARHCALRGKWPELMKTVAILMEDVRLYDVHAVLRNTLYCIVADPALNDPSFLESYLSSNPRCSNAGDVKYCIDKILEVLQGVTIIPTVRRSIIESLDDNGSPSAADSDGEKSPVED